MFTLVRINVPSVVRDPDGRVVIHVNPDHVWDYVVKHHSSWRNEDVKLLYMTRRHLQEDTSLIIDAKSVDALTDFLTKHIASLKYVRGIWVIYMAKMRFFKIPVEHSKEFSRFTITIDEKPQHLQEIYDKISAFEPGRDVTISYIAHTFQSYWASIMISVLARSRNHLDAFVDSSIRTLNGVIDADVTGISKTIRLVTPEEWEESVGPYIVAPGGHHVKEVDAEDDSLMTGC